MKITDEQSNLIDAYIKKQLKGEDLEAFENELETNNALKEELAFRQDIRDVIQLKKVKAAIEKAKSDPLIGAATERKIEHPQLEVVHNMIQQTKVENIHRKKRRIRKILIVSIAASLLLLCWIGIKLMLPPRTLPQLAEQHFSTFPKAKLNKVTLGFESISDNSSEEKQKLIIEAEQAFKSEKWGEVLSIFEDLRNNYSYENDAMLLYEGIIYYQKANYPIAIKRFEKIINTSKNDTSIKHEAHWYLGSLYLKTEQKYRAKEQFKILSQTSVSYRKKANRILGKLN